MMIIKHLNQEKILDLKGHVKYLLRSLFQIVANKQVNNFTTNTCEKWSTENASLGFKLMTSWTQVSSNSNHQTRAPGNHLLAPPYVEVRYDLMTYGFSYFHKFRFRGILKQKLDMIFLLTYFIIFYTFRFRGILKAARRLLKRADTTGMANSRDQCYKTSLT